MPKINKLYFNWADYDIWEKDIHDLTAKSTLVDNDEFMIADSADSYWHKKITMEDIIRATHKPKVSVLVVWWWGGWGWARCSYGWWWWGAWGTRIRNEYWLQWTSIAVTVGAWWGGGCACSNYCDWCDWSPSCFWIVVANWGCGWGGCWGVGWNSGNWYTWWACVHYADRTSWWWWAWAGWNGCGWGADCYWGNGWVWHLYDIEESDIIYWWGWWWGWCTAGWSWTNGGWGWAGWNGGGWNWTDWTWWGWWWWASTNTTWQAGWNWGSWVVIVKYIDNWMDGIFCATWWTVTCCNWYKIHTFTSDWTFCIVS